MLGLGDIHWWSLDVRQVEMWLPNKQDVCRTCTFARHQSLSVSMVTRFTGNQQIAGSILVWGSQIIFMRFELDKHSTIINEGVFFQVIDELL